MKKYLLLFLFIISPDLVLAQEISVAVPPVPILGDPLERPMQPENPTFHWETMDGVQFSAKCVMMEPAMGRWGIVAGCCTRRPRQWET